MYLHWPEAMYEPVHAVSRKHSCICFDIVQLKNKYLSLGEQPYMLWSIAFYQNLSFKQLKGFHREHEKVWNKIKTIWQENAANKTAGYDDPK